MDVYPVNSFDPLMPGLVIAGIAIFHVFLAQFAVGGGMLMCYFQSLAMTDGNPHARRFVGGYFKVLVLISFVLGALTGVGIWFTAIQVSAPTIGAMVINFHWLWATEWTFFCLEIVAGYMFYRYHDRLSDRASLTLLILYSIAAWASLFVINGIISWQLTPGRWIETGKVADGFFNPTFWPSLLFRTAVSTTLAGLAACVVVNTMRDLDTEARRSLINRAALLMLPMVLMPVFGIWMLREMPADSRSWILGGSPAMTMFLAISVVASVAIGGYALIGLWIQKLYVNGATATLLLLLAFGATAGGEFVREGARKPYSIRQFLFSNGIRPAAVSEMRMKGCTEGDPYPIRGEEAMPNDQVRRGDRVYRRLCSVCHTIEGVNSLTGLTRNWEIDQMRMNIAMLQHTKPFMPPFAGNAEDVESLVQMLRWIGERRPEKWPESADPQILQEISGWLDEAGTKAAHELYALPAAGAN